MIKKLIKTVFLLLFLTTLFLTLFAVRIPLATFAARFLFIQSKPVDSDLIFVPAGSPATRLPIAFRLYDEKFAPRIWCTTSFRTRADLSFERALGFRVDEEWIVSEAARRHRIPPDRFRILDGSQSTYNDLQLLRKELQTRTGRNIRSVIIVSDPYHLRRIAFCVRSVFGETSPLRFTYASSDPDRYIAELADPEDICTIALNEWLKLGAYHLKYGILRPVLERLPHPTAILSKALAGKSSETKKQTSPSYGMRAD